MGLIFTYSNPLVIYPESIHVQPLYTAWRSLWIYHHWFDLEIFISRGPHILVKFLLSSVKGLITSVDILLLVGVGVVGTPSHAGIQDSTARMSIHCRLLIVARNQTPSPVGQATHSRRQEFRAMIHRKAWPAGSAFETCRKSSIAWFSLRPMQRNPNK